MTQPIIIYTISIIILLVYCYFTVILYGNNFSKSNIIPMLKIPKKISAIGVTILNKHFFEKIFHIGVLSLIEKEFIFVEKRQVASKNGTKTEILYKKNPEKWDSYYYQQKELSSEELWILELFLEFEDRIFYKEMTEEELKKEKAKKIRSIVIQIIILIALFILSHLLNFGLGGGSSSSHSNSHSSNDPFFNKKLKIYKNIHKKYMGSFFAPNKAEEILIYTKNIKFYFLYFIIVLISVILTVKDIILFDGEVSLGIIVLISVIVFIIQFKFFPIFFSLFKNKYLPIYSKILFFVLSLFAIWIFSIFDAIFLHGLKFFIIVPFVYVSLFWIYKYFIRHYTEEGISIMTEIEQFKQYSLCYENADIPTFSNENELIENLKEIYIFAFALNIEKKFLVFLNDTLEKNNLLDKSDEIYEKLYISTAFDDKKLLSSFGLKI